MPAVAGVALRDMTLRTSGDGRASGADSADVVFAAIIAFGVVITRRVSLSDGPSCQPARRLHAKRRSPILLASWRPTALALPVGQDLIPVGERSGGLQQKSTGCVCGVRPSHGPG
jgi:hypothetical protein